MQELTTHTRLATGANKDALNLDYMVHIRNAVVKPLIDNDNDGIEAAIDVMGKYHLMRSVFFMYKRSINLSIIDILKSVR